MTMIRGCILSLLSASAFAFLPILTKLSYQAGLTEWDALLCRYVSATFFIALIILFKDKKLFRISPKGLLLAVLIGSGISTILSVVYFKALLYLPASTSALILYGYPAVVTVQSVLFTKMPLSRTMGISLFAISGGCALVFYDAFLREADPYGLLLMTTAMLLYATYIFTGQFLVRRSSPLTGTFYLLLFTALPYCLIHPPTGLLDISAKGLFTGIMLGLVPTAIGIGFLYAAIEIVGSAYTSIFSSIEPVCTLGLAALLLDEPVVIWQIFGVVFILFGVLYPNIMTVRKKRKIEQLSQQTEAGEAS